MSSYRDAVDADRRLVILQLLARSNDYTANEYLMHSALPSFGHSASMDLIRTDIGWLEEQGLVTAFDTAGVRLAKLTQRGDDVAAGRARVEGVKRPSP